MKVSNPPPSPFRKGGVTNKAISMTTLLRKSPLTSLCQRAAISPSLAKRGDFTIYASLLMTLLVNEKNFRVEKLRMRKLYKFYTLRSLPQFLISVILACPESFLRSRTSRKDSRLVESPEVTRQAGMTLKTNIQFQTPYGLCRRVLHRKVVYYSPLF
jgi:hypothetical protein